MRQFFFVGLVVAVYSMACGGGRRGTQPSPADPEQISSETRNLFRLRCAPCHGASGRGDGDSGWHLNPKPQDLSLDAWQRTASDAHIEQVIVQGGMAVGLSPIMPAHPDLHKSAQLIELRLLMRSFGNQQARPTEAASVFKEQCAPCHGERGRSDGLASARLPTRPPDFSLESWQSKTTDAHIMRVILEGGNALGLSPAMPAHQEFGGNLIRDLVGLIRSFAQPEPQVEESER